jgi:ferritin-like metal-binding protein YciE
MTLQDLLVEELRGLYDGEQQLIDALPLMAQAANSDALRAAFESHLEETRTHGLRLEEVFVMLGVSPDLRRCAGIAGIVEEASRILERPDLDGAVLDAGLIAGAQQVEQYEISGYRTCVAWARTLGLDQVAKRLEETVEEETAAQQTLSDLAELEVNISATHEAT